jgi:DNA-binding beta-propeller fold protein YncE
LRDLKTAAKEEDTRKGPVSIEESAEVISLVELGAVRGIPRKLALEGHFLYVLDSRSNQIHIYDGRKKEFVSSIGKRGEKADELEQPVDLLVTRKRYVWVVDSTSHAVKRFGPQGKFDYFIGGKTPEGEPIAGYARGTFTLPVAVAADGDGRIYVAEEARGRVQRFTRRGAFDELEISLSSIDASPSFANYASDIDVDRQGDIFILDANNNLVYKFDKDGKHLVNIGGVGQSGEPGKFRDLSALCVDRTGQLALAFKQLLGGKAERLTGDILITAERGEVGRLQFFTSGGEYIAALDFEKVFAGTRNVVPVDVAVGGRGGVYVVDLENNDILMVKFDGGGK